MVGPGAQSLGRPCTASVFVFRLAANIIGPLLTRHSSAAETRMPRPIWKGFDGCRGGEIAGEYSLARKSHA